MGVQTVVLVDGSNLYFGGKAFNKMVRADQIPRLMFSHIGCDIFDKEIHYFSGINYSNSGQLDHITRLSKNGVEIHPFDLVLGKEKQVDVAIAVQIIEMIYTEGLNKGGTVVCVSGDADLIPAYQRAKDMGYSVFIAGYRVDGNKSKNRVSFKIDEKVDGIYNILTNSMVPKK